MTDVGKIGLGGKEAIVGKTNNYKGGYWGIRGDNNSGCMSYIIIGLVVMGLFLLMYLL